MAYPSGVSLAVVTSGNAFTASGDPEAITISMTPVFPKAGGGSLARIVHEPTGWVMSNAPDEFVGQTGTSVSFSVPHVDQTGFRDPAGNVYTGWHYRLKVTLGKGKNHKGSSYEQIVRPIVGQDILDLELIPEGDPGEPSSVPAPAVTSVNGYTGAVVIDVGDSLQDPDIAALIENPETLTANAVYGAISARSVATIDGVTGDITTTVTYLGDGLYEIGGTA